MNGTITVSRAALGKAVAFASLGLASRPVLPVLGGMRAVIAEGALELAATDYEVHATERVPGDASGTAGALVDGRELATAIRSLPKGKALAATVTITGGEGIGIACDGATVTVAALPAEAAAEYPQFPPLPPLSGAIDGALFARAAARAGACAGKDDTLPVLTCVALSSDGGMLELAATDRYRVAIERQPWTGPDTPVTLVPAVALGKFAKACDKAGKVSLHLGDPGARRAGLSDGTRTLTVATNSGEYPRYRQLAGKPARDYPTVITASGKALAAAVTRAGDVTGRGEAIRLAAGDAGITLAGVRDGKAAGTQRVAATVTGPPVEAGFNPAFLASVLAGIPGDARIEVPAPSGEVPAIRTPARVTSGDGFTALVVPQRSADEG